MMRPRRRCATTFLSRQNRIAPLTSGALVLWPITILSIVHQVRTTLEPGSASDFIPVWNAARDLIAGGQPYHQPGFVYPPSATLLFAPLGLLTFDRAHLIFHGVNAVGILFATFLAFRTFKVDLSSIAAPALTFAVFLSAPVRLTLYTENVNGIILAAAMAAFICAVDRRWTAAGLAFGVTLAIKPVLMPLLMLFVFVRQWRAVASAVAVPVFLSAIALPFFGGASSFVTDVIPFLLKGNYAENYIINTSLRGAAEILGLPSWLASVARVVTLAAGVSLIWLRANAESDRVVQAAHLVGLALTTTFLVFSFSWPYYALYLLPAIMSVLSPRLSFGGLRYLVFGVAVYLIASQDYLARLGAVRVTLGYLVFLSALAPWPAPARLVRVGEPRPAAADDLLNTRTLPSR